MGTPLARGWEVVFRLACADRRGESYQDLFAQIMGRRDAGFERVRPWGRSGDRKNDGWCPARRMLFQCYAPSTLTASDLVNKLEEDYTGAAGYWKSYFDTWVFVHNDLDGMAPVVAKTIAELDARSEEITCLAWGYEELREEFAQLTDADRTAILGPPLTEIDFVSVGAQALKPLIAELGFLTPDPAAEVSPVPAAKIHANDLLPAQIEFLGLGSGRAPLVEQYLGNAFRLPSHADAVAEAVSSYYRNLRNEGRPSADIFDLMLAWICGGAWGTETTANALAVLAYFFERCHIFERPEE